MHGRLAIQTGVVAGGRLDFEDFMRQFRMKSLQRRLQTLNGQLGFIAPID